MLNYSQRLLLLVLLVNGMTPILAAEICAAPTTHPHPRKKQRKTAKARKKLSGGSLKTIQVRPRKNPKADHLEPTGFATVVPVRKSSERVRDLSEVLHQHAGFRTRSSGGIGSWSALSIRGSSSAQVRILVDGIPLNHGSSGVINLSDLPLEGLQRLELYRGFVPPELGGAMGGAVNLVTAYAPDVPVLTLSGTYGSWGTHRGMLFYAQKSKGLQWSLAATVRGSKGDFTYFDDRGTPYNLDDDLLDVVRENNDFQQGTLLGRLRWKPAKQWTVNLTHLLTLRTQGIPGLANFRSLKARYENLRNLVQLSVDGRRFPHSRMRLTNQFYFLNQHEWYNDPDGEIGLSRQSQANLALAGGWKTRWLWFPVVADWGGLEFALLQHLRRETFTQQDELAQNTSPLERSRLEWVPALSSTLSLLQERLRVTGSIRVQSILQQTETQAEETSQWLPSGRVGLQFSPVRGLQLKANAGRYVRIPTFWELFGDRGAMVGNPALVPESGLLWDTGLVFSPTTRFQNILKFRMSAAFFWTDAEKLIRFVQNSQRTMIAINIDNARTLGVEGQLRTLWLKQLGWDVDVTWMQATNLSQAAFENGKQLPGRPTFEVSTRLRWERRWGWVQASYSYFTGMFLDVSNLQELPSRHWVTLSASLALGQLFRMLKLPFVFRGLSLNIELKNLTDERRNQVAIRPPLPSMNRTWKAIADYSGYPLPGRTILFTLAWKVFPLQIDRSSQ